MKKQDINVSKNNSTENSSFFIDLLAIKESLELDTLYSQQVQKLKQLETRVQDWEEWALLGDCYQILGYSQDCKRCYRISLSLNSENPYTRYSLGKVLINEEDYLEAISLLEMPLRDFNVPDNLKTPEDYQKVRLIWLAQANYNIGEYFRALGYIKAASSLSPGDSSIENIQSVYLKACLEKVNGK